MNDTAPIRSRRSTIQLVTAATIVVVAVVALGVMNRPKGADWPRVLLDQAERFDVDVETATVSKIQSRWAFPTSAVLRGSFRTDSGNAFFVEARRSAPFLPWTTVKFAQGSAAEAAWE